LYPSSLKEPQVQAEFEALLKQRIPYHRKNMMYSASCVPVTSLFTLVPFVPNIPLFYNAFRLWSHWKGNGHDRTEKEKKTTRLMMQLPTLDTILLI
jgi:hypothetical protein